MNKNVFKKLICTALVSAMVLPTCIPVSAKHDWLCSSTKILKQHIKTQSVVPELESKIIKAIEENDLETLQRLCSNNSNNFNIQIPAEYLNNNDDFAILRNLNVDRNFFQNFSLLDLAILSNSIKCFKFLLLNGASTALSNFDDILFYAAYAENTEFMTILKERSCNFDQTNIDFVFLPALNLFNSEESFNMFFHCLNEETINQLEPLEAVRILTLLLLSEKKYASKKSADELYARLFDLNENEGETLNQIIEKALSDYESAMYLAAAILSLPESELPLYTYLKEKFYNDYLSQKTEQDENFEAKLYASIIKCFHDVDDVNIIKKLVDLIKETGCTEKLDLTSAANNLNPYTALGIAIEKNDIDLITDLIILGANINSHCCYATSPIKLAVEKGYEEVANILIQNGVDINETEEPLFNSQSYFPGRGKIIELLINKGLNLKKTFNAASTYLHYVRDLEDAKVLLDGGAEIDAKNDYGQTALWRAAWDGNAELIDFLIERGADINTTDNDRNTILHAACNYAGGPRNGDDECHNEKTRDLNVKAVESILRTGRIDINAQNHDGNTPLHLAAMNGNERLIDLLLTNGADPYITNNDGATPFLIFGTEEH